MSDKIPVWLLQNLVKHSPAEVYEEAVLSCTDQEINAFSTWVSNLMREFDEALLDV